MKCSFCNVELPKGTEFIFAKKDGTVYPFCSSKCRNNQLRLKRVGKKSPWVRRRKQDSAKRKAKAGKGEK